MTNNTNTETAPMTQQEIDLMHALAFHIARGKVRGFTVSNEREAQFLALSNRFISESHPVGVAFILRLQGYDAP